MKRIFTFAVNNGGTMTLVQVDDDGPVTLSSSNDPEVRHIPAGDMVMLMNWYRYVKDNDIQDDFINPQGKNAAGPFDKREKF